MTNEARLSTVISSVALGECPYAMGSLGIAATEGVVYMLHGMSRGLVWIYNWMLVSLFVITLREVRVVNVLWRVGNGVDESFKRENVIKTVI